MTLWPSLARRAATWSSSVDLPMPGSPPTSIAEPEPDRAQPDLLGRFLARDIDDLVPFARKARGDLEQQRRLADAGIAADQHRRAGDDAAADRPVEFGNSARQPLRQRRRRLEADQRD